MKRPITTYAFSPSTNSIDFSSTPDFDVRRLFAVINLNANGAILYAPTPTLGYVSYSGAVVQLGVSTASMSSTDPLIVLYDDDTGLALDESVQELVALLTSTSATAANQVTQLTALDSLITGIQTLVTELDSVANTTGQASEIALLGTISTDLGTLATAGGQASALTQLTAMATALGAINSSSSQVASLLRAQVDLTTSLWTDGTSYYVRREELVEGTDAITITFTHPDGTAATVSANSLQPVTSNSSMTVVAENYDAVAAGTGYAVGDLLVSLTVINTATTPPTASAGIWLNLTQGTTLASAPVRSSISEQTRNEAIASNAPRASSSGTLQNGGDAVVLSVDGMNAVGVQVSGTWVGLLSFQASMDGGLTFPIPFSMTALGATAPDVSSTSTNGNWEREAGAVTHVRVTAATPLTSGVATALVIATNGIKSVRVHAGSTTPLPVETPVPNAVVVGQVRIATTGTAVQLPSNALVNGLAVKASIYNQAQSQSANYTGAVGGSSVTTKYDASAGCGWPLAPGEGASFSVGNSNAVWVNGTAGDVFSFEGN